MADSPSTINFQEATSISSGIMPLFLMNINLLGVILSLSKCAFDSIFQGRSFRTVISLEILNSLNGSGSCIPKRVYPSGILFPYTTVLPMANVMEDNTEEFIKSRRFILFLDLVIKDTI